MKYLNFLTQSLALVTLGFGLSGFSQEAQVNADNFENPQAFQQYLDYINPSLSRHYNIDTTWLVKGEKETEEAILLRIETQLRNRLAFESNTVNLPSWLASEAIVFERQVVCDQERTDLRRSFIQSARSSYAEEGSDRYSASSASSGSVKEVIALSSGLKGSSSAAARQQATVSQYESYRSSGYTVINTQEKTYASTCVKKHLEFRGTLVAEKVLKCAEGDDNLKLYFIRKGLNQIFLDFSSRHKAYSEVLQYVLNTANISQNEVAKLGYDSPAALISRLKAELSSLISTYIYMKNAAAFFKSFNYVNLSLSIAGYGNDMKLKLQSTKSLLESFSPKILTIGFNNGNQLQDQYFYSEEELVELFDSIGKFSFNSRLKNPADSSKAYLTEVASRLTPCENSFYSLLRQSQDALDSGRVAFFQYGQLSKINGCGQMVTISVDYHGNFSGDSMRSHYQIEILKYLRGKKCIFVGSASPSEDIRVKCL